MSESCTKKKKRTYIPCLSYQAPPLGLSDPTKLGGRGVYRDVKLRFFFYTVKFSFTNFWDIFRVISRKFWSYLGVLKVLVPQKLRFGPKLGEGVFGKGMV